MFEGFEGDRMKVKMWKPGKKKFFASCWERHYVFVMYMDAKGSHDQDEGGKISIIKDLDEKH